MKPRICKRGDGLWHVTFRDGSQLEVYGTAGWMTWVKALHYVLEWYVCRENRYAR